MLSPKVRRQNSARQTATMNLNEFPLHLLGYYAQEWITTAPANDFSKPLNVEDEQLELGWGDGFTELLMVAVRPAAARPRPDRSR